MKTLKDLAKMTPEELIEMQKRAKRQRELEHAPEILKDRMIWLAKQLSELERQDFMTEETRKLYQRLSEEFHFLNSNIYVKSWQDLYLEWKKRYGGEEQ